MEKNINQLKKRLHRYIIYQRAAGYYDNYKKLKRYQEESKRLSKLALNAKSNKELFYLLLKSPIINSNQKENEILGLLNLVRKMDPKVILEIGTQRGGTLFLFSQVSNLTTKLISIDYQYPSREYRQSLSKLAKRGQKLVSIQADSHSESTLQQVKKLIEQKGIDFLFINYMVFGCK